MIENFAYREINEIATPTTGWIHSLHRYSDFVQKKM